MFFVTTSEFDPSDTVKPTLYCPEEVYICDGDSSALVDPSQKSQAHEVGAPVDLSVNCTVSVNTPEVLS